MHTLATWFYAAVVYDVLDKPQHLANPSFSRCFQTQIVCLLTGAARHFLPTGAASPLRTIARRQLFLRTWHA